MRLPAAVAGLFVLTGCGSSLGELANTEARFLAELERTMPSAVDAQDAALKRLVAIADRAEEQALRDQWAAEIAGVTDAAIAGARVDLANPSRDAIRGALGQLVKYRQDRQRLLEAAREAREAKARAILDAMATLAASASAMAANQRAIAQYLEAQQGLLPLGGFSIHEPIENVPELLARLKAVGQTLDVQFARAKEIFDAAKKDAEGQ